MTDCNAVLVGAAGNFIGGGLVTILWFAADRAFERAREQAAARRAAAAVRKELSRLRSVSKSLVVAGDLGGAVSLRTTALTALVRTTPSFIGQGDIEAGLMAIEEKAERITALKLRLFVECAGVAQALRNTEDLRPQIEDAIRDESASLETFITAYEKLFESRL